MGNFDGILICTDLDGTLLRKDKSISAENLEAIEYFKKEGGTFTFITGRMPFFATDTFEAIKPNAPFGCINGGGLYDYHKQDYIWTSTMPDGVKELAQCVEEKFPNVGIQTNTFYKTYFSKENAVMQHFRSVTGLPNLVRHYSEVAEPIAKILFGTNDEEEMAQIAKTLALHPLAKRFDFIRSERTLYEILPKGISKGTAIEKLTQYLNIDINKTIAIGDYDNDIPMFQTAKIGVATANACPNALRAADYVTVSNEEHAIAQLICDLENGKYAL